jgi:hypothetical protein
MLVGGIMRRRVAMLLDVVADADVDDDEVGWNEKLDWPFGGSVPLLAEPDWLDLSLPGSTSITS